MEKTWQYEDYHLLEGLKPQAAHFQYFYTVFSGKEKRCSYCIWIEDDALSKFDPSGDFNAISRSNAETWRAWVKENLDRKDFRNLVLKHTKESKEEIDLDKAKETVSPR